MKIKTSELTGAALNWVCAIADGKKPRLQRNDDRSLFKQPVYEDDTMWQLDYTAWGRAGPIIERERIDLMHAHPESSNARMGVHCTAHLNGSYFDGPTPLIAAMRCFVASKLGDEVEVPDELIKE